MPIITISRGTFAGGERLALALAARLGYPAVSRERLFTSAQELFGIQANDLLQCLEQAPAFQAAGVQRREEGGTLVERCRRVLIAAQAALCALVKDDNVVYHGQAGHLLLPGISHVLRIRLIAPRPLRIEMAVRGGGLSPADASRKIDQVDSERTRWTMGLFGVNWGEPLLFDMVLNLERMSAEQAADLVVGAARLQQFQATEASTKAMRDLALASRVAASLLSDPAASSLRFDVLADDGAVRLVGLPGPDTERIRQAVAKIDGVKAVE